MVTTEYAARAGRLNPLRAVHKLLSFAEASSLAFCLLLSTAFSLAPVCNIAWAAPLSDLPPDSVRVPPMVKEKSISTYVPSEACPGSGVAVNLIYPNKARYKDGAPVAVVCPGGYGPDGLSFEMHACQVGVIEVRFAYPGGGSARFGSGGEFDARGDNSLQALIDVILFAGGLKKDYKDRTILDLLKDKVKVQNDDIGLVGWDTGGNQALAVLGKHYQDLSFVKWLVFYESPVGSMFSPSALGSAADLNLNSHYRQGSAATGNILIDYKKLNWSPKQYRNPNRLSNQKRGAAGLKGVLFFDENSNGIWEESNEFAFTSALDPELSKQYFPPQVTGGIQKVSLFNTKFWPQGVANIEQSEAYFADRDGSLFVEKVSREFPDLMVTVFGSAADHDQQQPDHPHIAFLYNLFLTNKVRFLRLNPDPNYMAAVGGMNIINFANNTPNGSIDSDAIMGQLEGEGLLPDYVYIEGAVAELCDRTKAHAYKPKLNGVIVNYTNGAVETPKPDAPKPDAPKPDAPKPAAAKLDIAKPADGKPAIGAKKAK